MMGIARVERHFTEEHTQKLTQESSAEQEKRRIREQTALDPKLIAGTPLSNRELYSGSLGSFESIPDSCWWDRCVDVSVRRVDGLRGQSCCSSSRRNSTRRPSRRRACDSMLCSSGDKKTRPS